MSFSLSPDNLFTLVKSMTPAEKRYFKLQSGLYRGNKAYIRLYDILDQLVTYDEAELKRQMAKNSTAGNFSVIKKYLFEQIIKSLKNYGAYRDPDSDLNELIETYKILQYKGMHRLSERVLLQAKKKAYEDDAFLRLCYILVIELISLAHSPSDDTMSSLYELNEERRKILEIIQNYSVVGDHLYLQRKMIRQIGKARDASLEKALFKNIEPLLKMNKSELLSRTAEGMYNMALSDYYSALGDVEQALHYLSGYISHQTFPADTSKIEIQFLNEYSTYFTLSLRSRIFQNFEYHLDRFKCLISPRHTPIDIIIFERWLYYSLTFLNINGRFSESVQFFDKHSETFHQLKGRMTSQTRISLYYAQAYSCFGIQDYNHSLRNVLAVIDKAAPGSEVSIFARLLGILIYYETKNWAALDYSTRSVYRYLLKTERLFRTEKFFLAFIRQLPSIRSEDELLPRFIQLHSELNRLFQDSREADIEYYIHIRAWLRSKIGKLNFAECVKEQAEFWKPEPNRFGLPITEKPDSPDENEK